ncbi:MAG TPA: pitrilysin family protein [Candidatus Ozemobacteraceae bacterium]|nr:pitrilysin family protein [Candidatus Ozemobacteraceae bacterium]
MLFPFSRLSAPIETIALPNGVKLVLHPFASPSVGVACLIRSGPIFEAPDRNGISHFLEHMLFRGTPEYPTSSLLCRALDRVGSEANAATFSDMTILSCKMLPESLGEGLQLLHRMMTAPTFSGLTAERHIILEECLEDQDEDGQLTAIDQLSSQLLYGDHPYALSILGMPDSVRQIQRRHLEAHLHAHFRPESTVVALAGGFDPKKALSAVRRVLGSWRGTEDDREPARPGPVAELNGPRLLAVDSPRSQVQVRISFRALAFGDPEFHLQKSLVRILDAGSGSPLRQAMQDSRGFCYSLSVGTDAYERAGAIHIDFSVNPDVLEDAVGVCLRIMAKLAKTPLPDEDVEHMLYQYVKAKRFASTDVWDFSGRYAFRALYPSPMDFAAEFAATQKTRPADLHAIAARLVRRRNLGVTLVGDISKARAARVKKLLRAFPD